jgi:hypothetical protein
MRRSGVDELYVLARSVLLDALEALGPHREACVLVGAQAIYLRVGEAGLAVPPFTTDADLVVDPRHISDAPPVERGLTAAGFALRGGSNVGIWVTRRATPANPEVEVEVDMLVPEAVSGATGRRAARLPGHEPHAARIARGLEGALFDADVMRVGAFDDSDTRTFDISVAGPGALLVSKLHKIHDRAGSPRANDKDAYDVLRLLSGTTTAEMATRVRRFRNEPLSKAVTEEALGLLGSLFGRAEGVGSQMAVRAARGLADPQETAASCVALAEDILQALRD